MDDRSKDTQTMTNMLARAGLLTVDLGAIVGNWRTFSGIARNAKVGAVVKANAYGLGIPAVVSALFDAGCELFFTATVEEALNVRLYCPSASIYVFEGLITENVPYYADTNLTPVLGSIADLKNWHECAPKDAPYALHVETGINRYGIEHSRLQEARTFITDTQCPEPVLIVSHFACADEPENPMNNEQIGLFKRALKLFPNVAASLCNSSGVFLPAATHFDVVRAGIALYGGRVTEQTTQLRPVIRLAARVMQFKTIPKGQSLGYGAGYLADSDTRIAICGIGYADGLIRAASLKTETTNTKTIVGWIGNHAVPMIGRISMDCVVYDVTAVPKEILEQCAGIEVLNDRTTIDDFADAANTIAYEVLTRLGARLERQYINTQS
ncbi:alanine racemase [uncultured Maritalea sp.]|uniref:alanine racemase n=1 Tax=uncultured Maritalea sp. TaxID=757249 RepID=UPI002617D6D8|nr:alanine racemase [uncultured Maritalea sp.]